MAALPQRLTPHPPTEPVLSVGAIAANSPAVSPVLRAAPHPGASSRARAAQPFGGRVVDDEDGAWGCYRINQRPSYRDALIARTTPDVHCRSEQARVSGSW